MTTIGNNSLLMAEIGRIAEVAGYLWTKGWAERNGGNISVNLTGLLTPEEMEKIRKADKNCRLIKGQVFLWQGASGWEDLWDLDGKITGA